MRKSTILTAVAALAAAIMPAAASAQSLDGLLRTITGASYSLSRNCGSGAYALSCQVSRVTSVTNDLNRMRNQRVQSQRQQTTQVRMEMIRSQSANRALEAACRAGDAESCSRAKEGTDDRILNAIVNACSAGDQRSCERMRGMRDARYAQVRGSENRYRDGYESGYDRSAYPQSTYRAPSNADHSVRIDPVTGYRIVR